MMQSSSENEFELINGDLESIVIINQLSYFLSKLILQLYPHQKLCHQHKFTLIKILQLMENHPRIAKKKAKGASRLNL